ncbi:hypothetical protein BJL95_17630 [Methylomonas sp. LWB]|nr:hypothetical protein BJL95_17630 [Methylomonas sp. LWB]
MGIGLAAGAALSTRIRQLTRFPVLIATQKVYPATLKVILATLRAIHARLQALRARQIVIPAMLKELRATLRAIHARLRALCVTLKALRARQKVIPATLKELRAILRAIYARLRALRITLKALRARQIVIPVIPKELRATLRAINARQKAGRTGIFIYGGKYVAVQASIGRLHVPIKPTGDSDFKTARYSGRKAAGGSNPKSAIDSDAITLVKNDGFWEWRISALSERARGEICTPPPEVLAIANVP